MNSLIAGKNFRAIRKKLRLTQEELAREIAMTSANVRRVEGADATTIREKSFRKLAELLKVPLDDLEQTLAPNEKAGTVVIEFEVPPEAHDALVAAAMGRSIEETARDFLLEALNRKVKPINGRGSGAPDTAKSKRDIEPTRRGK